MPCASSAANSVDDLSRLAPRRMVATILLRGAARICVSHVSLRNRSGWTAYLQRGWTYVGVANAARPPALLIWRLVRAHSGGDPVCSRLHRLQRSLFGRRGGEDRHARDRPVILPELDRGSADSDGDRERRRPDALAGHSNHVRRCPGGPAAPLAASGELDLIAGQQLNPRPAS